MIKIHTDKAPAAVGPYSQAIVSGGMVYTSGQIAINPETNTVETNDIQAQTEQIMKNLGEEMTVESEPGKGSAFSFTLHASAEPQLPASGQWPPPFSA